MTQYTKTPDGELVGHKMRAAVVATARNGDVFPSKNALAVRVGPNGSQDYGYRIVNRCIRKGLISYPDPDHPAAEPHGSGAIKLTDKGRAYLEHSRSDDE